MRAFVFIFVPFFTACNESAVTKFNATPDVVITSHAEGDTVRQGESVLLTGQVGDADNDPTDLNITWTVGGEEACPDTAAAPDGGVLCETTFSDNGSVILSVSDPSGAGASASVNLEIQAGEAPMATITQPTATGRYYADQTITFEGTVADTEDAPEDLTVTFETDALGDLGMDIDVNSEGNVRAFGPLAEGEHAVLLRVIDTSGKEGSDTVVIAVGPENTAPTCAITAPEDGAIGPAGEDIRFDGIVGDVDVSPSELTASWESDIDGPLRETTPNSDGTVGFVTNALSGGTHRITLTVTDEMDEPCTTSVYYTVTNDLPVMGTVTITPNPAHNDDAITCEATATDPDGETISMDYAWTGGSTGATLALDSSIAAPGDTLTCTATATDEYGGTATGTASITLTNRNPSVAVSLTPEVVDVDDAIACTATELSDPDDDTVTATFSWTINGAAVAASTTSDTDSTLSGGYESSDVVRCTASAEDGRGGTASAEASTTIAGGAVGITSVNLTPSELYTDDTVTAEVTVSTGGLSLNYAFTVDETVVQDGPINTLNGLVHFGKHDTVGVTVTATDGDATVTETAVPVIVLNSPPTAPAVSISETSDSGCLPDWSMTADGERCVKVFTDESVTWNEAQSRCEASFSSDLASVHSDADTDQLVALAGGIETIWIGYTDSASEDAFVWTDGTPSDYENWRAGEPSDDGGAEHCTHMYTSDPAELGLWNDFRCDATYGFSGYACNMEVRPLAEPNGGTAENCATIYPEIIDLVGYPGRWNDTWCHASDRDYACQTTASGGCAAGWTPMADGARCVRVFDDTSESWFTANATCATYGGSLVSVLSREDNNQLFDLMSDLPLIGEIWIGYSDEDTEGEWAWSGGEISGFTNWRGDTDLTCVIDVPSTDADEDTIDYSFAWDVDGTDYTETETTTYEGDSIPNAVLSYDELWTCEVTPDDGDDSGPFGTASFLVENCDLDDDGYEAVVCGGYDCDDSDPTVHPLAGDTFGDGIDSDCDSKDCEADFHDGTYFAYCSKEEAWHISDLRSMCSDMGYDGLATVRNASDNVFLTDFVPSPTGFIVGGNDIASEGTWVWDSGYPMSFTNWASGEPNNGGGEEHCLALHGAGHGGGWDYQWNDTLCSHTGAIRYVCELR